MLPGGRDTMTMRFRVLLFAAVSVGLVGAMGSVLLLAAVKSGSSRELSLAYEEQLGLYGALERGTVESLGELMRVDVSSEEIRTVLSARETRARAELERMQANLDAIHALGGQVGEAERRQLLRLRQDYLQWLKQTGTHLTSGPEHAPVDAAQLGVSMTRFRREVKPLLAELEATRRAEREQLQAASLQAVQRGRLLGVGLPVLALGAVLALAAVLFLPLHRTLRDPGQDAERAAELEEANARLRESLQRLQRTQGRLLSLTRVATVGQIATDVGSEISSPLAYLLSNINYAYEELSRQDRPLSLKEQLEVLEALSEARQGAERVHLIARELKVLSRTEVTE
jgi:phosphoglycerate-specific signal transduction histidine kinase